MRNLVITSQHEMGKENGLNLGREGTVLPCRGLSSCGVTTELVCVPPLYRCHPSLPPLAFTCTQEPRRTFARRRVSGIRRGWVQRGRHAGEQPMRERCDPSLRSSGASYVCVRVSPPTASPGAHAGTHTAARRARLAAAPARKKEKGKKKK